MKILTLIRHAKSSWQDPFMDDFDRPLNPRGRHDLPLMCARLQTQGPAPDRLIHSSARRTRLTAAPLIEAFQLPDNAVLSTEAIYEADDSELLALIRQQPDELEHLMLVGHNPGLQLLAQRLCDQAPQKLPTAAIVQLELPIMHWHDLTAAVAQLRWFDAPKLHART